MATQEEAKAFLRQNYKIANEDGDLFGLVFDVGNGRTQMMVVEVRDTTMRLASRVAKGDQASADQVLNASESIFGITLMEGDYYLTHVIFLENVDANEITTPIEVLSSIADEVENSLGIGDLN